MTIPKTDENKILTRFMVRRYLRQIRANEWTGATSADSSMAANILADRNLYDDFVTELLDGAKTASGIALPENSGETAGSFMDAMLQIMNWIKDNPEFILFIIKMFGGL